MDVHTKSSKFNLVVPSATELLGLQRTLESEESKLYSHLTGKTDAKFEDFRNLLHSIKEFYADDPDIFNCLQIFTNDNLHQAYEELRLRGLNLTSDTNINITINSEKLKKQEEELRKNLVSGLNGVKAGNSWVSLVINALGGEGIMSFGVESNLHALQEAFNSYFKQKNDRGRYTSKTDARGRFANLLKILTNNDILTISQQGGPTTKQYTLKVINALTNTGNVDAPFNYTQKNTTGETKDNLEEMAVNNERVLREYFLERLTGHPQVKQAFEAVWPGVAGIKDGFMQGSATKFYGDGGELQAAIFMQLIKNSNLSKFGNLDILLKGNDKFTQGPLKGKKLPVDVLLQLGEDFFGIQAKNFQSASFLDEKKRSYTTKLNSGEFSFSSAEKESIINVYFNSSYSKGSDPNTVAANIAKAHGPELLRLAQNINTGAETDRNNFFFIDGTYLVPGSVIFQIHIDDLKASGPSPINNDEGFAPVKGQRHPLFVDYWRYPKGKNSGDMIAVKDNAPTVSSIGSAVEFNITFILSMDQEILEQYNIFKM